MLAFSETQFLGGLAGFSWALVRVSSLFVALPLFAGHLVPIRVRVLLAFAITSLIYPTLPPMPPTELFSLGGFLIDAQQFVEVY